MSKEDLERRVEQMKQIPEPGQDRGGSFQSMGQILNNMVNTGTGSEPSPTPTKPKQETRLDECICKTCSNKFQGEVITYNYLKPPKEYRPTECPACKKIREDKEAAEQEQEREELRVPLRSRWRKECGMPPWLLVKTFDNWNRRYQKEAYQAATEWAKKFELEDPKGYRSLIFYSNNPGVGKGHLMTGIVNYLIENWKGDPSRHKCPIRFESGPSLVRRIRATYHLRNEDQNHEREDEVYSSLAGVALLLLDDVGKESPSDFTRETYWYIIDERVKAGLPVIMSSRLPFEGPRSLVQLMGEDTVDRLFGMTGGQLIEMPGESFRSKHGIA